MSAYRKPTAPEPEREREPKRGTRVRMPETPEEIEAREKAANTSVLRAESRVIALELERERVVLDRGIRLAGGVLTAVGIFLVILSPLPLRGAGLAGLAVALGPALVLFGGQGATSGDNLPFWLRCTYAGLGIAGLFLGSILLT